MALGALCKNDQNLILKDAKFLILAPKTLVAYSAGYR